MPRDSSIDLSTEHDDDDPVVQLQNKIHSLESELNVKEGKNRKIHEIVRSIRDTLLKEVCAYKTGGETGLGDDSCTHEIATLLDGDFLESLRSDKKITEESSREGVQKQKLDKLVKAEVERHKRTQQRDFHVLEDEWKATIRDKNAIIKSLESKLEAPDWSTVGKTMADAKEQLFELRESCFYIRHVVYQYRRWLTTNSIIPQLHSAVTEQASVLVNLGENLQFLTNLFEVVDTEVINYFKKCNPNILVDCKWIEDESAPVNPSEVVPQLPTKILSNSMFKSEVACSTKVLRIISCLANRLRISTEKNESLATVNEEQTKQINDLTINLDFANQQNEMLKGMMDEITSGKRVPAKKGKKGKDIRSEKRGTRRQKSRNISLASRSSVNSSRSTKSMSHRSGGSRSRKGRRSRHMSTMSRKTRESSDGASSVVSCVTGISEEKSFSKNEDQIQPKASIQLNDDDDDEDVGDDDKMNEPNDEEAMFSAVISFQNRMEHVRLGNAFIMWIRRSQARYSQRQVRSTLDKIISLRVAASPRCQSLGSIQALRKRDQINRTRERISNLTSAIQIPAPDFRTRPKTARPHCHTMNQMPSPAIPDLNWIRAWREATMRED